MEKDEIILHEEFGVNPSVEVCLACGKEMGVIMFGAAYDGEAPKQVCMGHLCDDCSKVIKDGGVYIFEAEDENSITGRYVAIKREAALEIFKEFEPINYLEKSMYEQLFGDIPDNVPEK